MDHNSIKISQILEQYRQGSFGVPHFQRGAVWGDESVSLLLESLFFDTPCGTVLLWEPSDRKTAGVPIGPHAHGTLPNLPTQFILDGQQRIRNVCSVLEEMAPEPGKAASSKRDAAVWCLNAARCPALRSLVSDQTSDLPLFWRMRDPHEGKGRYRHNLLPLRDLWNNRLDACVALLMPVKCASDETIRESLAALSRALHGIVDRELFQVVLREDEASGRNALKDVVEIYNRINSAGIQVEDEERAYATLVTRVGATQTTLTRLFRDLEGKRALRDDLLQRKREQRFGFKLFIRSYVQGLCQHSNLRLNPANTSFSLLEKRNILSSLDLHPRAADALWTLVANAVRFLHRHLTEDLRCDDLRFCPDAGSLMPAMALLLRFPELSTGPRRRDSLVSLLLLKTFLADLPQTDRFRLCNEINDAESLTDVSAVVLDRKHAMSRNVLARDLAPVIAENPTVQSRYASMFYWLLRRKDARDLSYRNLGKEGTTDLVPGKEVALDIGAEAEKQHLVPYSRLRNIYPDLAEHHGRVGRHPANDLGNLTYISGALNGFDGLADTPIELRHESDENRSAHFLTRDLERRFTKAPSKQNSYEQFCKRRRDLIARGFQTWVEELEDAVRKADGVGAVHAAPGLFEPLELEMDGYDYDDEVRGALRALLQGGGPEGPVGTPARPTLRVIGADPRRWPAETVVVRFGPKQIVVRDVRPGKQSFEMDVGDASSSRRAARRLRELEASLR